MSNNITHYKDHIGTRSDKFYKTTLYEGEHLMIGLNCLEPRQVQAVHTHDTQDKFYFVLEGCGHFILGEEVMEATAGQVIWAKAGISHGVENQSEEQLVIFMGIAPAP